MDGVEHYLEPLQRRLTQTHHIPGQHPGQGRVWVPAQLQGTAPTVPKTPLVPAALSTPDTGAKRQGLGVKQASRKPWQVGRRGKQSPL